MLRMLLGDGDEAVSYLREILESVQVVYHLQRQCTTSKSRTVDHFQSANIACISSRADEFLWNNHCSKYFHTDRALLHWPDSTQISFKPASWKHFAMMDSRLQIVWNVEFFCKALWFSKQICTGVAGMTPLSHSLHRTARAVHHSRGRWCCSLKCT